jgi:hypothetical protein
MTRGAMQVLSGAVYEPEDLSLLGKVFDELMQSLPPDLRTPRNRMVIARALLACCLTGERDPDVLGRTALMNSRIVAAA